MEMPKPGKCYKNRFGSVYRVKAIEQLVAMAGYAVKLHDYAIAERDSIPESQGFGVYHLSYETVCSFEEIKREAFDETWVELSKQSLRKIGIGPRGAFMVPWKHTPSRRMLLSAMLKGQHASPGGN